MELQPLWHSSLAAGLLYTLTAGALLYTSRRTRPPWVNWYKFASAAAAYWAVWMLARTVVPAGPVMGSFGRAGHLVYMGLFLLAARLRGGEDRRTYRVEP